MIEHLTLEQPSVMTTTAKPGVGSALALRPTAINSGVFQEAPRNQRIEKQKVEIKEFILTSVCEVFEVMEWKAQLEDKKNNSLSVQDFLELLQFEKNKMFSFLVGNKKSFRGFETFPRDLRKAIEEMSFIQQQGLWKQDEKQKEESVNSPTLGRGA